MKNILILLDIVNKILYIDNDNGFHYQKGLYMRDCHRWGQRLKGREYRLTFKREAIINVLSGTDEHPSAEDIYMKVHTIYSSIGLTTIYRTLDILKQMGIVSKFEFGQGKARYELSDEFGNKKHHHHLICKSCGKIIDYFDFIDDEKEFIKKTEKGLKENYNFEITEHLIRFYGVCSECKR